MDFVLPFVVGPLFLEIKLCALGRLQFVNEIDLDLIQVYDVRNVATCRVKGKIAIDGAVVSRVDLKACLESLGGERSQSRDLKRFLYKLEISLGEQFHSHVRQSLVSPIHNEDLEKDVVMMDFNEGFSVDWVRVSSELVDLSIYLLSNVPKEVF